jgi:RNA polymerase sigma-70 factor (ECF subfamily)
MAATASLIEDLLVGVYRDQRARLWGFFLRGAGNEHVAEDLLQELFLRLWDHRERIAAELEPGDREGMRRYLWRAARNLMIDEIRVRQRRKTVEPRNGDASVDPLETAVAPDHHDVVEHEDCLRMVRETVSRLKNARARSCMQGWLEGRELTRIADENRLSAGQVRGILQRARSEVILRAGNRLRPATDRERGTR